jgi:hypothetical protein
LERPPRRHRVAAVPFHRVHRHTAPQP